ncbi:MAG: methylenetetrahydrofolate reductase [NAD(P)H] [Planctomycetota bacterium]
MSVTRLSDHFRSGSPRLSFELFPPKTSQGVQTLLENVQRLMAFDPAFFTVTYGAGGSTQTATLDVAQQVANLTGRPVASHLTCVGATTEELRQYLQLALDAGIRYIVALRGDPPKGSDSFTAVEGGLRYANELVDLIHANFSDFSIAVAGYPEVHQEASDRQTDLDNLKRKVDAGADIIITQLFYDNTDFYRFRDDCAAAGITVPVLPGLLPVINYKQAQKIAGMCKAAIPASLADSMNAAETPEEEFAIGVEHARQQTIDLLENDVDGLHYYVLNRSKAALQVLEDIQLNAVGGD